MFASGKYLKNYYSDFLTKYYYPKNIYVRSIDTDRSLSTISAFVNGMYYDAVNSTENIWQKASNWIPIPVHTQQMNSDSVINYIYTAKIK